MSNKDRITFAEVLEMAVIYGLLMLIVLFFVGVLMEAMLTSMGAMAAYGLVKFEIPIILGGFGFITPIAIALTKYHRTNNIQHTTKEPV
jgi:hypothetical protein